MKSKMMVGLLSAAALMGMAASADAKVLELRVRSGGAVSVTTHTFFTPSNSISKAGLLNNINYSATGTFDEVSNHLSLDLTTLGTNTTNTVKSIQYALTATGVAPQATLTTFQEIFSGFNAVGGVPLHTLTDAFVRIYYDTHNVKYGTQHLLYDSGVLATPGACGVPASYSCVVTGALPTGGPFYSITALLTVNYKVGSLNATAGSSSSFTAVPEPTSLALLGTGLLMAGWWMRRRRNNNMA